MHAAITNIQGKKDDLCTLMRNNSDGSYTDLLDTVEFEPDQLQIQTSIDITQKLKRQDGTSYLDNNKKANSILTLGAGKKINVKIGPTSIYTTTQKKKCSSLSLT